MWVHLLQKADFKLETTENLSEAVCVRQETVGVWDLREVDLRVVLLHAGQAKHVTWYQQIRLRQETLGPPPTWDEKTRKNM